MLRLKIYKNELLQMPETELAGENTTELLDPYLTQCQLTKQYKTIYGRLRRAARYAGIPMWGILRNKALQSSAFLADQMVKLGMAEWLEFNEDQFNPRKAIGHMRNQRLNQEPKTEEHLEKLRQSHAVMYQNMTEEQKAKRNAALKAGWERRRANPDAPKIVKQPMTEEHRVNLKAAKQKQFATMTEEQKAERSAALKAGWAKRRERLAAEAEAKKQEEYRQKLIAAGRLPASDDQIPAWFKMPENN